MVGGQQLEVVRVVGHDQPAAQADGGGDDEGVDGQLAATVCVGEKVTGVAGDAGSGGDHPGKSTGQLPVDGLVVAVTSVDLDEDGRWHSHRLSSAGRRTHGGTDPTMALGVGLGIGEGGECLGVEDQGHCAS